MPGRRLNGQGNLTPIMAQDKGLLRGVSRQLNHLMGV